MQEPYRKGSSESILASNLAGNIARCFLKRRSEVLVGRAMRLPVSSSEAGQRILGEPALSLLRYEQIYRPVRVVFVERAQQCSTVPTPSHRLDESAAGYSLVGCSPAEPASASPLTRAYAAACFLMSYGTRVVHTFQRTRTQARASMRTACGCRQPRALAAA
jgi:hypothetical protein